MTHAFLLAMSNDTASKGVSIAAVGLLIVFSALLLISVFIANLPSLLAVVGQYWPEVKEPHTGRSHPDSLVPDDDAVLAAIGFVLHTEFQRQLTTDPPQDKG